jgi:hypothetical protein
MHTQLLLSFCAHACTHMWHITVTLAHTLGCARYYSHSSCASVTSSWLHVSVINHSLVRAAAAAAALAVAVVAGSSSSKPASSCACVYFFCSLQPLSPCSALELAGPRIQQHQEWYISGNKRHTKSRGGVNSGRGVFRVCFSASHRKNSIQVLIREGTLFIGICIHIH